MKLNNLIGQSLLVERIENIITCRRVAHAYLFTGPKGIGKNTIAGIFAKALLCDGGTGKPCELCNSCKQLDTYNHPDFERVKLEKASIGVNQIRDMQREMKIKPYKSNWKIYIIENAHKMTEQAQNALLKTLEEPPEYVVIFLLAESIDALLPTVISRCQGIRIGRLKEEEIKKILMDRNNVLEDKALVISRISEGIPGRAIKLLESEDYLDLRDQLMGIISDIKDWRGADALSKARYFVDKRDMINDLMDILLIISRDILIYKETGNKKLIVNLDKITEIQSLSLDFTTKAIKDIIDNIESAEKMLSNNVNYQLAIENMLIGFQEGEI